MSDVPKDLERTIEMLEDIERNGENSKYQAKEVNGEIQLGLKPKSGDVFMPWWSAAGIMLLILFGAVQCVLGLFKGDS